MKPFFFTFPTGFMFPPDGPSTPQVRSLLLYLPFSYLSLSVSRSLSISTSSSRCAPTGAKGLLPWLVHFFFLEDICLKAGRLIGAPCQIFPFLLYLILVQISTRGSMQSEYERMWVLPPFFLSHYVQFSVLALFLHLPLLSLQTLLILVWFLLWSS